MTGVDGPWPLVSFKDAADYNTGRTPARAMAEYWAEESGNIPWVTISDLKAYGTVETTKESISAVAHAHVFRGELVPAGTLLMSFKLTIGRVARLGIPAVHNEAIISIYPKAGVDQRFLGYYLSQVDYSQFQDRQIKGNTLNKSKIDRIPVPVPPPSVQTKIADVLDALRDAIAAQEQAVAVAADLKRCVMTKIFDASTPDVEDGHIPPGWTVGPVSEFALFQRGFDITKNAQVSTGSVPVVSSGGVKSFHNASAATGPGVVIGRKGSIGSVHYVETDYWPHDTTLWCTDFKGNVPKFVFYRMQQLDMKRLDSGATNPALNRNFLHAELVSWPAVPQQQEIVDLIEAIDQKIETHELRARVLHELFDRVLHGLMDGEISMDDLVVPSRTTAGSAA